MAIKIFILRIFLALFNSSSGIFSLSLFISSTATLINSYEWDPGPSIVRPNNPESEKWELIAEAPSTKLCFCIRLVMALQYIPFPGPPDEKLVAFPIKVFITYIACKSSWFQGTDSNARVILVYGDSVQVLYSPPMYYAGVLLYSCSGTGKSSPSLSFTNSTYSLWFLIPDPTMRHFLGVTLSIINC